ncbi:RmlD substrate binding domain-containing protein [Bacillus sp. UNCCL13]|nr:RmlD substrate binding domain-containing protein [Bacillus sp. UNCCL13]
MRILVIGANGTVGKAVSKELAATHEIISAGRKEADITVDITSPSSIAAMYEQVGKVMR